MGKVKVLRHQESGVIHGWNPMLAKRFDMEEIYINTGKPAQNSGNSVSRLPKLTKIQKAALIKAFGNATGIQEATEDQLSAVDGIGAKTVQKIIDSRK